MVAGSSPAGRKLVAQLVERTPKNPSVVFSSFVCFCWVGVRALPQLDELTALTLSSGIFPFGGSLISGLPLHGSVVGREAPTLTPEAPFIRRLLSRAILWACTVLDASKLSRFLTSARAHRRAPRSSALAAMRSAFSTPSRDLRSSGGDPAGRSPCATSETNSGKLDRMDAHELLGDLAAYSCIIGDGGPRGFRRRGAPLPEKYLPGRFLAGIHPDVRAEVVRAANTRTSPAPWFLRLIIDADEPNVELPSPPVDRRWSCCGRWSL